MSRRRRILLIAAGTLVSLGVALLFALYSTGLPAWLVPRLLPDGARVAKVQGSLAGGLSIEGLEWPGLRIASLSVAADLGRSLSGTPTLARLEASGIRVDPAGFASTKGAPAEAPAPRWPDSLPRFAVGPVSLADIDIAMDPPIRIDTAGWTALQSRGPSLTLDGLDLRGPDLELTLGGTLGWSVASELAGSFRHGEYAATLKLSGLPADLDVALALQAPLAAEIGGRIRGLPEAPSAELRILLPELAKEAPTLMALKPLLPLAADLTLSGDLSRLRIGGSLRVQGQTLQLAGTELATDGGRLRLMPLRVGLDAGQLEVEGDWPLASERTAGQLTFRAQSLAWPGLPVELAALEAELRGDLETLAFRVDARTRSEPGELPIRAEGRWAAGVLELPSIALADDALRGEASWQSQTGTVSAALRLDGLDLSLLLPDQPSRLSGQLSIEGAPGDWHLAVRDLKGDWRSLPLTLAGDIVWDGVGLPAGTLDAQLDGNRLRLRPIDAGHQATLQLGEIDAFLPGAAAAGRIELQQRGDVLDWRLALERASIPAAAQTLVLGALDAHGQLTLGEVLSGEVELQLTTLQHGEDRYGPISLGLRGDRVAHRLVLEASTPQGRVDLSATGGLQASGWTGFIDQLSIQPMGLEAPPLALAAPWPLVLADGWLGLQRACLTREKASLCLDGSLDTVGTAAGALSLTLSGLDLALLPRPEDAGWRVEGAVDGSAGLTLAGTSVASLSATLAAPAVQLTVAREEGDRTLRFEDLALTADGAPTLLGAGLQTRLKDAGPLSLRVDGLGGPQPTGTLQVDFASLSLLNGWSPELVNPEGRLAGRLTLGGSAEALDVGGALTLSALRAELPGAGLKVSDGELSLQFPETGVAALNGSIATGEGLLRVEAQARRGADGQPQLSAELRGERVLVADLPNVRLLASPAVTLQTRDGVLVASGTLGLPEGRIDLERFEPGVTASADVVVLDRPVAAPAPVRTDIRYTLGPALQLKGFGLDATLRGGLRIRSRPGRPVTASGTLDLAGGYRAYGQKLTIDRGRLLWANAPIGNPGFDFSAYRTIDQLKAGVRVRGSASAPELTVYTDPPREASDALSWLVLGRPLSSASGDDGQQLSAAAGALGSVGGALIGATIGQRLGVEINVESSAELGGSPAFTVGKMLSPKLFVGFGRSLFDSAQLVIVRYRLTEHYELEALSGRESKIGANYRIER